MKSIKNALKLVLLGCFLVQAAGVRCDWSSDLIEYRKKRALKGFFVGQWGRMRGYKLPMPSSLKIAKEQEKYLGDFLNGNDPDLSGLCHFDRLEFYKWKIERLTNSKKKSTSQEKRCIQKKLDKLIGPVENLKRMNIELEDFLNKNCEISGKLKVLVDELKGEKSFSCERSKQLFCELKEKEELLKKYSEEYRKLEREARRLCEDLGPVPMPYRVKYPEKYWEPFGVEIRRIKENWEFSQLSEEGKKKVYRKKKERKEARERRIEERKKKFKENPGAFLVAGIFLGAVFAAFDDFSRTYGLK